MKKHRETKIRESPQRSCTRINWFRTQEIQCVSEWESQHTTEIWVSEFQSTKNWNGNRLCQPACVGKIDCGVLDICKRYISESAVDRTEPRSRVPSKKANWAATEKNLKTVLKVYTTKREIIKVILYWTWARIHHLRPVEQRANVAHSRVSPILTGFWNRQCQSLQSFSFFVGLRGAREIPLCPPSLLTYLLLLPVAALLLKTSDIIQRYEKKRT